MLHRLCVWKNKIMTVWIQESALCCLMKFAAGEGEHPLEDLDWNEHFSFPRELIQVRLCAKQPGCLWWEYKYMLSGLLWLQLFCYIVAQAPSDVSIISSSGSGGQTAEQNNRQLPADLQVPGVPWDGRCSLLRHEFHPWECGKSHGQKQRGRGSVLSPSAVVELVYYFPCHTFFYLVNMTWCSECCGSIFFLSGAAACISEQRVHPHVQHQCSERRVWAHQLYDQTGRWDLLIVNAAMLSTFFCGEKRLILFVLCRFVQVWC